MRGKGLGGGPWSRYPGSRPDEPALCPEVPDPDPGRLYPACEKTSSFNFGETKLGLNLGVSRRSIYRSTQNLVLYNIHEEGLRKFKTKSNFRPISEKVSNFCIKTLLFDKIFWGV